jgi:beta-lactamase class D
VKKSIPLLIYFLLHSGPAFSDATCFLVEEKSRVIRQEGNCAQRHAPCSTFKIAISLMGYNEGILLDQHNPVYPYKKGYPDYIEAWKQPQNPTSWIKNSCVWYSQKITQKLGMKKFKHYLAKLNYGNQEVSGDPGKNNGLTNSWLSSSLTISPEEQVKLLQKLIDNKLPITVKAQEMTKHIMFVDNLSDGWKLYGKTGSGNLLNADGSKNQDRQMGWFVGWIEKGERKIIFADYVEDTQIMDSWAGKRAKEDARQKLMRLIQENHSV